MQFINLKIGKYCADIHWLCLGNQSQSFFIGSVQIYFCILYGFQFQRFSWSRFIVLFFVAWPASLSHFYCTLCCLS
jgi:hypothetical protein